MSAKVASILSIKCFIASDGTLLAADPLILRLHVGSGGVEDGVFAVTPLREMARLCWQIGAPLERCIVVPDFENDLELWVRAEKRIGGVGLTVLGWHEIDQKPRTVDFHPKPSQFGVGGDVLADIVLNKYGRIVSIEPNWLEQVGLELLGQSVEHLIAARDNSAAEAALIAECVNDGREADHLVVQIGGSRFDAAMAPVRSASGELMGFGLTLGTKADGETASKAQQRVVEAQESAIGRHFATAVRQPLNRILANAETIRSEMEGPLQASYTEYARDIASAAKHLAELVGDLEDLDAIDRSDFKVAREAIELGDIARRVAGLLALKAADQQIEIELPPDEVEVHVVGEFRRVLQIILNLVGNAIRYGPGGSKVTIVLNPVESSISVDDSGDGIEPDDRERIFLKFERLGRSGDGGSGLGLYISRKLARAMGGDLTAGESPTGGARFTLRLPDA